MHPERPAISAEVRFDQSRCSATASEPGSWLCYCCFVCWVYRLLGLYSAVGGCKLITHSHCISTTECTRRCDALSCIRRIRFLLRIRVKKPGQGSDPWPDPTRTQIADPVTGWPVTRRPGSISEPHWLSGRMPFFLTHTRLTTVSEYYSALTLLSVVYRKRQRTTWWCTNDVSSVFATFTERRQLRWTFV